MVDSWSLNIRLLDQSAQPVELAAVCITASPVPVRDIAALSGPDGRVSIAVPCEGDYGVAINAEGFSAVTKQIAAVDDGSGSDIRLNA